MYIQPLCSHWLFCLWTLYDVLRILCIYVVRVMGKFMYSKCKVISLLYFAYFWHENFWRCSSIELFPSSGSHKHSTHIQGECDWSKVFLGEVKMAISCASLPAIVVIKKSKGLFMPNIFPRNSSPPTFQDPIDKSHFNLKTRPWKFYNQCCIKYTQNTFDIIEALSSNMQHGVALDANTHVRILILNILVWICFYLFLDTSNCK
jgi:hypothetical protein